MRISTQLWWLAITIYQSLLWSFSSPSISIWNFKKSFWFRLLQNIHKKPICTSTQLHRSRNGRIGTRNFNMDTAKSGIHQKTVFTMYSKKLQAPRNHPGRKLNISISIINLHTAAVKAAPGAWSRIETYLPKYLMDISGTRTGQNRLFALLQKFYKAAGAAG